MTKIPSSGITVNSNQESPNPINFSRPEKKEAGYITFDKHSLNDQTKISTAVTSFDPKVIEEMNQILANSENEIEEKMTTLGTGIQLMDTAVDAELLLQSYPEVSAKVLYNTAQLFSAVLPPNIPGLSNLNEGLDLFKNITTSGSILLSSLSHGTSFIGVACKHKMIKQSHYLLEKLQADFQKKLKMNPSLEMAEETKKTQSLFEDWNKNLKIQEIYLNDEKKQLAVSSSLTFSLANFFILDLVPVNSTILTVAGVGFQAVIFVTNWVDFIRNLIKSAKLKGWQESYQMWRTRHIDVIDKGVFNPKIPGKLIQNTGLTNQENQDVLIMKSITADLYKIDEVSLPNFVYDSIAKLGTIIKSSKNLLHKRQATAAKKHLLINSNYQDYESKIKERNFSLYNLKLAEMKKNLYNSSLDLKDLEIAFNDLIFFSQSNENEDLLVAFNQYKSSFESGIKSEGFIAHQVILIEKLNQRTTSEQNLSVLFDGWFSGRPRENLIENYIDHQHAFEQTLKNSLKELVQHKHTLESKFLTLANVAKGSVTSMSLLCLFVSISLIVIGLLTSPMGFGLILLITSIGPAGLALGFMTTEFFYALYNKPETTKAFTYPPRLAFRGLGKAFYSYRHNIKQKALWTNAKMLRQLVPSATKSATKQDELNLENAIKDYTLAKADLLRSQKRLEEWTGNLTKLEREYAIKGWHDFVKHSSLVQEKDPKKFDSLRAFNEALIKCDFSLLSDETKTLLEEQLGINLKKLQTLINHDPDAISSALQQYASMTSDELVDFIIKKERSA